MVMLHMLFFVVLVVPCNPQIHQFPVAIILSHDVKAHELELSIKFEIQNSIDQSKVFLDLMVTLNGFYCFAEEVKSISKVLGKVF